MRPFSPFPKKSGLVLCPVKCVHLSFLWHTYELRIVYVFVFVFVFCIQCTSFFSLTWCIFSRRIIPPLARRRHTTLNFPPRPSLYWDAPISYTGSYLWWNNKLYHLYRPRPPYSRTKSKKVWQNKLTPHSWYDLSSNPNLKKQILNNPNR